MKVAAYTWPPEHGTMVVYTDSFTRTKPDAEGNHIEREVPFLKTSTVSSLL